MSKVFAKYTVIGNSEDLAAFEMIIRHIEVCQHMGSSREIKIIVDGDGSANLRVFREDTSEDLDRSNYPSEEKMLVFPKEIKDDFFHGKKVELGTLGVIAENGDGKYWIGE